MTKLKETNTATISTEVLKDDIAQKMLLNQQIGDLKSQITFLKNQISDKKFEEELKAKGEDGEAMVKIITEKPYAKDKVRYVNLESIKEEIERENLKLLKYDKLDSEAQIDDLLLEVKRKQHKLNNIERSFDLKLKEGIEELNEKHLARLKEKDKTITELEEEIQKGKEELQKVIDNKTDEELAIKRKKEITDLRNQISELKAELNRVRSMNIIRKFLYKITHHRVEVEVEKDLQEKKRREREIVNRNRDVRTWFTGTTPWF